MATRDGRVHSPVSIAMYTGIRFGVVARALSRSALMARRVTASMAQCTKW
ncbi:hypothetical protein [Catenulispora yoronensis]